MKNRLCVPLIRMSLPLCLLLAACASVPESAPGGKADNSGPFVSSDRKIPVAIHGVLSDATLALVEKTRTIDGQTFFDGGLAFYFVLRPRAAPSPNAHIVPTIREDQNFSINGGDYWQNSELSIDSRTVVYSASSFAEENPEKAAAIGVSPGDNCFVQKTIICGETLPPQGTVVYDLYFGYEHELECFKFVFDLKDIQAL